MRSFVTLLNVFTKVPQQPTSFRLDTFSLREVFDTPELISSLASYSTARQSTSKSQKPAVPKTQPHGDLSSVLFLRVLAAADYFSSNKTLMQNVPDVNVDISTYHLFFKLWKLKLTLEKF